MKLLSKAGLASLSLIFTACIPNTQPQESTNTTATPTPLLENSEQLQQAVPTIQLTEITRYQDFSPSAFAATLGQKRILFFHASWCPTCIAANKEIIENVRQIPEGVVVFKTDYDQEIALKQKYTITYQHTFVQVDEDGNELAKWSGGGIDEIIENTL